MDIPRLPGIAFILLLAAVAADTMAQEQDSPGTADHPLVSRYTGSYIDGQEVLDFTDYTLPVGPAVKDAKGQPVPSEKILLEGKVTRTLYRGPKERSTLEILRNYESALEAAGFEILFSCNERECGKLFHWIFYHDMGQRIRNTKTSGSAFDIPQKLRYVAAKGLVGDKLVNVSVLVAFDAGFSGLSKQPITLLEVIESEAMDTGMVTVDAEAMAKGIDATGHIAIYGVYFDTDSAEIKAESSPTLAEIAKLLDMRPSLKLLVVGHTDNQGEYEYNLGLSGRRATAVAGALIDQYGIDGSRLQSAGVGYLAPVASNDTPAGREKNRRVELVKQ
ncbi:MAG: OmpA family protein [Planctomycetota bacterium]|jgi:outer membrane protein OmpA-like peptidoglycan-associated protein